MNLDAASSFMNDLKVAVSTRKMYDRQQEFFITMTFGVEECDYCSDITAIISRADKKLYYGKEHGRNQVVF
jgi:PleD family two-component response regulator